MRCSSCSFQNAADKKFCIRCGAVLGSGCPKCSSENPPEASFCGNCGTLLPEPAGTTRATATPIRADHGEPRVVPEGERRHLTVLFSDLVGSTEIASHLDPEEWREIVADYHHAAATAIERYGGMVAQYLGDGVMAYFGWPEAHDNDAERGIHASLAILGAVSKLNELPDRPKLSVRIGIDSGAVVVGAGTDKSADVFGDTPNIAARVQAVAQPGTAVVTEAVHRLVAGLFVIEDCGAQALKGIERPVRLYRVVQPSGVRGRLQAATAAHGLTRFIGREDELRLLMNRWERALEGERQVVLIAGEAGIGKSRLVQRFHELILATTHTWVEAAAGALYQNTPFHSISEMLREFFCAEQETPAKEQVVQLESALELAGLKPAEALPLVAPMLNLPLPEKYPALPLSPEQQRRKLLATLVEWVLSQAKIQPLVITIEDLHWADPSTLELIQLLIEKGATARLLLLYTARPEFRAPWPARAHHTQFRLDRLSARNVRTMVEEVAARMALSAETIAAVVDRTGGVPLFVEELTRAVLESGGAKLTGSEIPVTLHDSLMARLDRLGRAKEVAQTGAVIGSEFSYQLLHAVNPIPEEDLQRALRKLVDAELIYVHGIPPEASYTFKHALIRDAAYDALLKRRRKDLHRLVAHTINENFSVLKDSHPEVLARHWTEAGEIEPAIAEWSKAGKAARSRNAFKEARDNYRQAIGLLVTFPESPERGARELRLTTALLGVLKITGGYTDPEFIQATAHAKNLAEKSGNFAQLVLHIVAMWASVNTAGDIRASTAFADQALDLASRSRNPASIALAHMAQIGACLLRADLVGAEDYFARGIDLFAEPEFQRVPGSVAYTFGTASLNALALGRADTARERSRRSILGSSEKKNPYEETWAKSLAAELHLHLREHGEAAALARQVIKWSDENGFSQFASVGRLILGSALANLGQATEGMRLIRQGLNDSHGPGAVFGVGGALAALASAQALGNSITEALTTVEEALQTNAHRPETVRLRGEFRFKLDQAAVAEADFREAIALAQIMSAKTWELRATMSLARLLKQQGKRDEARGKLAAIYGWFTEGFDTADLKEAKALLQELGA